MFIGASGWLLSMGDSSATVDWASSESESLRERVGSPDDLPGARVIGLFWPLNVSEDEFGSGSEIV